MKKIVRGSIVIALIVILVGCTGGTNQKSKDIKVGIALYDRSDVFISEMLGELRRYYEDMDMGDAEVSLSVRDAKGSQRSQNDQVEELIDEGCNVLCVNLVDRSDTSEIVDNARKNDIPVVFFNREPVYEDLMQWDKLYYVGADARQSGQIQGEIASKVIKENPEVDLNRDGVIQYVVMEGEPGHQDTIIRSESSVEAILKEGIELERLSYQIANWNRAQAQNRMEQMISQFQTSIELVLANNDAMALGVIDAYEKANITEGSIPIVFGIDGTQEGTQAVKDGRIAGSVYNDKEGQAKIIADLSRALINGEGVDGFKFAKGRCIYVDYKNIE